MHRVSEVASRGEGRSSCVALLAAAREIRGPGEDLAGKHSSAMQLLHHSREPNGYTMLTHCRPHACKTANATKMLPMPRRLSAHASRRVPGLCMG